MHALLDVDGAFGPDDPGGHPKTTVSILNALQFLQVRESTPFSRHAVLTSGGRRAVDGRG